MLNNSSSTLNGQKNKLSGTFISYVLQNIRKIFLGTLQKYILHSKK